jgi:non-homologous end joining protein Ku
MKQPMGRPYYIVRDGEVGQQAFAVIRKAIEEEGIVAIGRVVFMSRRRPITPGQKLSARSSTRD